MKNDSREVLLNGHDIHSRIYTIRGVQVMIDSDLAQIYNVKIKRLTEQVKRNIERFPDSFRFQLTQKEYDDMRSQSVTSCLVHGGRRYPLYVFTEQGVSMLSAVLRTETAVEVSIQVTVSCPHVKW